MNNKEKLAKLVLELGRISTETREFAETVGIMQVNKEPCPKGQGISATQVI